MFILDTAILQCILQLCNLISFFFGACATSIDASTMSSCSLARSFRVILPAPGKCHSDSPDDAGITKIFFASFDNSSNLSCACKNYKTGSDTGSVTLTLDPTRHGPNCWPGDQWPEDPVPALWLTQNQRFCGTVRTSKYRGILGSIVVRPLIQGRRDCFGDRRNKIKY